MWSQGQRGIEQSGPLASDAAQPGDRLLKDKDGQSKGRSKMPGFNMRTAIDRMKWTHVVQTLSSVYTRLKQRCNGYNHCMPVRTIKFNPHLEISTDRTCVHKHMFWAPLHSYLRS